jgi:hypothetical protein
MPHAGIAAGPDDLVAYRDELPVQVAVVMIRGGPAMTVAEPVERSGVPEEKILQVTGAAGLPLPSSTDGVFSEQTASLVSAMVAAEAMFGADAVLQLLRVMGASMARLCDAIVSAFLVNVEPAVRSGEDGGLALARADAQAAEAPAVRRFQRPRRLDGALATAVHPRARSAAQRVRGCRCGRGDRRGRPAREADR